MPGPNLKFDDNDGSQLDAQQNADRDPNLDAPQDPEDISEETLLLSSKNRSIFKRLTDRAKKTARNVVRSVKNKIPNKDDVCAKAQIVSNEFYMKRHERIEMHWGKEVEALQMQIDALQKSFDGIQKQIDNFRKRKLPGIDDLILGQRTVKMQIKQFEAKKDKFQSKYDAEQDKMIRGANERDRIAGEIIRRCKDKIEPFNRDLEKLQKEKNKITEAKARLEVKHAERKKDLDDLQEQKTALENALMMGKNSREDVKRNPGVKALERLIADGHKEMQKQKANLLRMNSEIDDYLAEASAHAAPTRDKMFKYSRMKEEAPIVNENVRERDRKVYDLPPIKIRPHIG